MYVKLCIILLFLGLSNVVSEEVLDALNRFDVSQKLNSRQELADLAIDVVKQAIKIGCEAYQTFWTGEYICTHQ